MYCEECGCKLEDDAKFCSSCGTPVPIEEAAPERIAAGEMNQPGTSGKAGGDVLSKDAEPVGRKNTGRGKKPAVIVVCAAAVVLIAAGAVFGVMGSRKAEEKEIPRAAAPVEKEAEEEPADASEQEPEPKPTVRDYYVDYTEAYKAAVREKSSDFQVTTWGLHDMDGDGMPELFVMVSNSAGAWQWFVYTFDMENGTACYLGEINAGALYEPENREAGIIAVWGQMGKESVYSVKKEGKTGLNVTEISHSENITQAYYSTPYPLPQTDIERLDLLGTDEAGEPDSASATGLKTPDGKEVYRIPGRAFATSVLQEPDRKHSTDHLSDLDPSTVWVEGAAGTGGGEAVVIDTQLSFATDGIAILPGYCRDQAVYEKNGRPIKVTVKCGDIIVSESLENFKPDFTDPLSSMVYIEFDEPVYADRITVVISEAVGGTQYEDICIAELFPYAHSYVTGDIK